jgi:alpha-beta hydrolase superfamily lysophospholipase
VTDPRSGRIWRCAANLTVPVHARPALQILVHGATYNHWYWDPPGQHGRYSYVQAAASRGYPTINIDRIGCGRSDHPDGTDLSLELHATTVNTIAALARRGLAGHAFDRIIGVGHSVGTYVLMKTLSGVHGLDAALLTGITHKRTGADPVGMNIAASDDPRFANRNSVGYQTLPARHRHHFYHLPTTDPAVVDEDISHRDVVGLGELDSIGPVVSNPCPAAVPLCLGLGTDDWMFAAENTGEFRRAEAQWYPRAPTLDFLIYADTGHNINLHKDGPRAMSYFLDWVESHA